MTNIAIDTAKMIIKGFTVNEKHRIDSKIVFGSFQELNRNFI